MKTSVNLPKAREGFVPRASRRFGAAPPTFTDVLAEHAARARHEMVCVKPRDRTRQLNLLAAFFRDRRVDEYAPHHSLDFVSWYRLHREAETMGRRSARGNPDTAAIDMLRLLRRMVHQYGQRHRVFAPEIAIPNI